MASFKRQNTRGFKQQSLTNRRTALVLPCLSPDAEGGRRWQLLVRDWWSDVESRPRQLQLQLQLQAEIVPRTSEWSIMVWKAADCRRAARPCMNCLTSLRGRDPAMEFQFLLKSCVRRRQTRTFTCGRSVQKRFSKTCDSEVKRQKYRNRCIHKILFN